MQPITITDVRSVPCDSAFLIDDGATAVLCDTGFAFTGEAIAEKIRDVLGERPLDYIFLTHSHFDHVSACAYIRQVFPEAKVVAGEYAAKILAKDSARDFMRKMNRQTAQEYGVLEYEDLLEELKIDISAADGDVIQAGTMRFQVISLPGHTRCSVGFYLEGNRLLIGSETLGIYAGDGLIAPSCMVGYQMTLDAIHKVEQMEIEQILIPHHGLLSQEETAWYLQNIRQSTVETVEKMAGILSSGGRDADVQQFFREQFYQGNLRAIYPLDTMELNTGIMIGLIKKEILQKS